MGEKINEITILSILAVVILFTVQIFFLYGLMQSNRDAIESKMDMALKSAYFYTLYDRTGDRDPMESLKKEQYTEDKEFKTAETGEVLLEYKMPPKSKVIYGVRTLRTVCNNIFGNEVIATEELLDSIEPFSFNELDNTLVEVFMGEEDQILYDLVYFNPKTNQVYDRSNKFFQVLPITYYSSPIYLNSDKTKAIILCSIPSEMTLFYITCFFGISVFFLIFSLYCVFFQFSMQNKYEELDKMKNNFFSEVSHEIIRSLSIFTQVIDALKNERNIHDVERRDRYLNIGEQEVLKMAKKTEMVLSLAREDEGMFELNVKEFDFVKIIYDEVDALMSVPPKNMDVDIDLDDSFLSNPKIYGDKEHLSQVVSNLISNAVKYSGDYLDLKIKLWRDNDEMFFSVKDNGFGIAIEDQILIFERYTRVSKHKNLKGHGIGLSYVKRIIEKHGGYIDLISRLGEGSEFIIRMPLDIDAS